MYTYRIFPVVRLFEISGIGGIAYRLSRQCIVNNRIRWARKTLQESILIDLQIFLINKFFLYITINYSNKFLKVELFFLY